MHRLFYFLDFLLCIMQFVFNLSSACIVVVLVILTEPLLKTRILFYLFSVWLELLKSAPKIIKFLELLPEYLFG